MTTTTTTATTTTTMTTTTLFHAEYTQLSKRRRLSKFSKKLLTFKVVGSASQRTPFRNVASIEHRVIHLAIHNRDLTSTGIGTGTYTSWKEYVARMLTSITNKYKKVIKTSIFLTNLLTV